MNIASRLDEAMAAAGFKTQMDLSRASGVPQPTINRILKLPSKKGPETETLIKLAAACNVSLDWLREGRTPRERSGRSKVIPISKDDLPEVDHPRPTQFQRHWLTNEEANILANYRSLTPKSQRHLRTLISGLELDDVDAGAVDKL